MAAINNNTPTRPKYMVKTMASFAKTDKLEVIPVDKPTVAKAETTSKKYTLKFKIRMKQGNKKR